MLITVDDIHWDDLARFKQTTIEARRAYTPAILGSIYTKWQNEMAAGPVALLHWLVSRTVAIGKEAAVLTLRQFTQPFHASPSVVIAPIRMAMNTVRRHLSWLVDHDFLVAYQSSWAGSDAHMLPKMYEINFKNLIAYSGCSAQNLMVLSQIQSDVQTEIGTTTVTRRFTPPPKLGGVLYIDNIYSYGIHRLGKPNQLPSAGFAAPTVAEGFLDQVDNTEKMKLISLATPKKRRTPLQRSESVTEVLQGAIAKRATVVAQRKAALSAGVIDKNTVQSLLDRCMAEYHPTLPRMVITAKPFGVLRKRIEAAKVQSFASFIEYSIREWHSLARQNRTAFLRNPSKAEKGRPLPENPTFSELAYRLPYFLAAYTQSLSTGSSNQKLVDADYSKLEARIVALTEANKVARDIVRRTRPATTGRISQSAPEVQRLPRSPAVSRLLSPADDGWTPPAWD